ncbi:hypothetical protein AJ80_09854 [Polytolypa hystricis UAMH7299]|uniref:C2H2-type domain-containing protein n=1 Tax=Polytolypa hystricis (strain UAMH7299) TaxID=1447883 RepID=A0A2B7WIB8_POLH7|nr:hypothetical protein AJ80_09854 [Polytolypa hystricis UAMH7299]
MADTERQSQCEICKNYYTETGLKRHRERHQKPRHHCNVPGCKRVFRIKSDLKSHCKRHEKNKYIRSGNGEQVPGQYCCRITGCTRTFKSQRSLDEHKKRHVDGNPVRWNDGKLGRASIHPPDMSFADSVMSRSLDNQSTDPLSEANPSLVRQSSCGRPGSHKRIPWVSETTPDGSGKIMYPPPDPTSHDGQGSGLEGPTSRLGNQDETSDNQSHWYSMDASTGAVPSQERGCMPMTMGSHASSNIDRLKAMMDPTPDNSVQNAGIETH